MRLLHAALILPFLAGSAAAAPSTTPSEQAPSAQGEQPTDHRACRDRIETVRAERGLPRLQRDSARPREAEALMFYAVDRQIDGCAVLVMVNDPRDVRPLPRPGPGGWQLLPAQ